MRNSVFVKTVSLSLPAPDSLYRLPGPQRHSVSIDTINRSTSWYLPSVATDGARDLAVSNEGAGRIVR